MFDLLPFITWTKRGIEEDHSQGNYDQLNLPH